MPSLLIVFLILVTIVLGLYNLFTGKLPGIGKKAGRKPLLAVPFIFLTLLILFAINERNKQISNLPPIIEKRFTITDLNVRSGPGTEYKKTDVPIGSGTEIYVEKDSADWIKVRLDEAMKSNGWVAKKYTEHYSDSLFSTWNDRQEEKAKQQREWAKNQRERERIRREGRNPVGAYTVCEKFVKRSLRAPATADFPWYSSDYINYLGNEVYVVNAYVDAQNGFGANIRNYFRCKVKNLGNDQFRLIDLHVGD